MSKPCGFTIELPTLANSYKTIHLLDDPALPPTIHVVASLLLHLHRNFASTEAAIRPLNFLFDLHVSIRLAEFAEQLSLA